MYYVVLRGVVPGIYTTMLEALQNICNVSKPDIRCYPSQEEANMIWNMALLARAPHAVPARSPYAEFETPPEPPRPRSASTIASMRGAKGPANELSIEDLREGPYHYTLNIDDGVKWVVIKGRVPGIYTSWYGHALLFFLRYVH
jgi:hypothetical protein